VSGAPPRWGASTIALHWLGAALVFGQLALGLVMTNPQMDLIEKFEKYQTHKSLGFVILAVTAARLLLRRRPRPEHAGHTRVLRLIGRATHAGLYALLLALPVTGFLMASSAPAQVPTLLFGMIDIPHPLVPDKQVYEAFKAAHAICVRTLMALVALHVAAALKHLMWDRDDVFPSMLPKF
jgi:cytochrome b561